MSESVHHHISDMKGGIFSSQAIICVQHPDALGDEDSIRRFLLHNNATLIEGDVARLVRYLTETGEKPNLLFVELVGEPSDIYAELGRLADLLPKTAYVFGGGIINDIGFYQSLIAMGLTDYFVMPIHFAVIDAAFERLQSAFQSPSKGKIISCIGIGGGVGTSTFAISLAANAARSFNLDIALMDCNPADLSWRPQIDADLLANQVTPAAISENESDDEFFGQFTIEPNLQMILVKASSTQFGSSNSLPSALENKIYDLSARGFHVLVDIGQMSERNVILSNSDHIIMIAQPDFRCFARAANIYAEFKNRYPYAQLHFVLNRIAQKGQIEFRSDEFAKLINAHVYNAFRNDFAAMNQAQASAWPILPTTLLKDSQIFERLLQSCNLISEDQTHGKISTLMRVLKIYNQIVGRS